MRKVGSIGILLPNLEVRIVDGDSNGDVDVEEGLPGELWVRGPTIMKVRSSGILLSPTVNIPKAYLGNKAATDDAITRDRWFKTGDIARRDAEGFYYIVDRRKELIKYKVIYSCFCIISASADQSPGFPR